MKGGQDCCLVVFIALPALLLTLSPSDSKHESAPAPKRGQSHLLFRCQRCVAGAAALATTALPHSWTAGAAAASVGDILGALAAARTWPRVRH